MNGCQAISQGALVVTWNLWTGPLPCLYLRYGLLNSQSDPLRIVYEIWGISNPELWALPHSSHECVPKAQEPHSQVWRSDSPASQRLFYVLIAFLVAVAKSITWINPREEGLLCLRVWRNAAHHGKRHRKAGLPHCICSQEAEVNARTWLTFPFLLRCQWG